MKHTLIIGGGPVTLELLKEELSYGFDLLIAADSGGSYLDQLSIVPHVLIGDFDSLAPHIVDEFANRGVKIIRFPAQKNETDMELALDYAIDQGSTTVVILGGLGGRHDHTLSTIGLLSKGLAQGVDVHARDEHHDMIAVNHRAVLQRKQGWGVSLVPLTGKVGGISTTGLVYPLQKEDLYFEKSRGIHNQFAEETATIELHEGIVLVILFKE